MSTTIDTNVVELKFDNKQFEEGCKESMSTLEKLKQRINDSSSGNALDSLNKTDLSGLEKSINKINSHFSLLGIAALKVKNSIVDGFLGMAKTLATTVPNIIKQGGWDRAMNIERAKFQLEGLKVAWEDISEDISYAVDGTAYGLDAAASAASQLVASGVQVGDSMKNALRAISGVAAMTNSEYEAISPIFTTVAGQGKLMTMQLRQLESRGLNAAAVLAESMGTTEAAVREMVTEGKIDFNTFAEAMDAAFGEHAKDANRTFEGVTANIRAALKKIGADFATPIIEQDGPVIQALQKLRERINDVRASLGPLTNAWTSFVKHYGTVAADLLDSIDMSFMEHVVNGLVNVFKALLTIIRPIGYAFKDIFAPNAASTIMSLSQAFESFTSKLVLSDKSMEGLRATVRGVLSIFKIFTTIIKQVLGALLGLAPETVNIGEILLTITGTIGNVITYISMVIDQMDIVGPAIFAISKVLKILIGLIALTIVRLIEFVNYISKLEITRNIINGLTIVVKALAGGILLLVVAIKNLLVGGIQALPTILSNIANGFKQIFGWLENIPIINVAAKAIKKLADAIQNLINPKIKDDNSLEKTVTIVDETVALAGPQNVKKIITLENVLKVLGAAVTFVGNALFTIVTQLKNFITFLGAGGAAALAFTVLIGAIGVKLIKQMEAVTKSVNAASGVLRTLGSDGIFGLIFGKRQQQKTPILLHIAVALAAFAGSLKLISTIPTNKLKEAGVAMVSIAGGLIVLGTAFTILGSLSRSLGSAKTLLGLAEAMALMTVSIIALNKLITDETANINGAIGAIVKLAAVLTGMSIVILRFTPAVGASALSLIGMAVSIRILVGALAKLSEATLELDPKSKDYQGIWGKTGYLMAIAAGLVVISGIASKLGTNSLVGILLALVSLRTIIPLANSVAEAIKDSIFADAWNKLIEFWSGMPETLKKIGPYILAAITVVGLIVGAVIVFKKLKKALTEIGTASSSAAEAVTKTEALSKALSRLSLVPVILALTGMMVAIGTIAVLIGKIKFDYVGQVVGIFFGILAIFGMLALVVKASENSKPAAVIAAMVGLTMIFSELIVLSLLIEKHYVGVIGATLVMVTLMYSLTSVLNAITDASETSTKALVALGMIMGVVAELGVFMYLLTSQADDWQSVVGIVASGGAMSVAMLAFAKMLEMIGSTGQSFRKNKFIAIAECAAVVATIGMSLSDLAKQNDDWKAIAASGGAMSVAMIAFAGMINMLGRTKVEMDASKFITIAECAVATIAIGAALSIATQSKDWTAIAAAGGAMSVAMIAFAGMAYLLGKMDLESAATAFVVLLGISAAALSIGASLALLAQYPWQDILKAAVIMAGTLGVLGVVAAALGAIWEIAIPGAIALDLLAVAMFGISAAVTMFLNALTLFLPVANAFIGGVLGTLVSYGPELPSVGAGLLQLAAGLAATGAAGIVLGLGAIGLLAAAVTLPILGVGLKIIEGIDFEKMANGMSALANANLVKLAAGLVLIGAAGVVLLAGAAGLVISAAGLTALVPACDELADIDITSIAKGLAALVVPGLAMALVGPAMTIGAAGIVLFTAALAALATVLRAISTVISPAVKAIDDLGKRVQAAKTWGADMIDNFVGGIKQKFANLKNAVSGIADMIASYLHFSTPDVGALSDADTWTPDFVDVLATGIEDNIPKLEASIGKLTESMDIEDTMKELGMSDMQGFMDGFSDMGAMDWFGNYGSDLGHWFGENLNISLTSEMKRMLKILQSVQTELDKTYTSKYTSKNGNVYRGVTGPSVLTQGNKMAKENNFSDFGAWIDSVRDKLDDYTTSATDAGTATGKATKEVKDLSNAFKTLERGAKVDLGNLTNTLVENAQETARWANDMKELLGKGYDSAITDWVMKMGVGGHETVKALKNGTAEEVAGLNAAMQTYLTLDEKAEAYILGDYEQLGGVIVQVLDESVQAYSTKLAETIQSAIDPFGEFKKETDLTGEQMLANMRSQITGITEWSDNVVSLMGRVPDELIQYFQDLGPASYEQVNAMAHMTEGQLAEAVTLWNQQLELGKTLAIQQAQKYREVGMAVSDGLEEGIDFDKAHQDGLKLGDEMIDGTKTSLDSHSPSQVFHGIGEDTVRGLENGIKARTHIPKNLMIILATDMINEAKRILSWAAGDEITENLLSGMKHGIEDNSSSVIDAIATLCADVIDRANKMFDEHSPSRVFRQIGLYLDEGLANGIDNGTDMAVSATQRMGDSTVNMMNEIIKNISQEINDSPEFQPTIRPRLDLTALQNGKSQIGGLFSNPAYGLAYNIAGSYAGMHSGSTTQVITNNTDVVAAINSLRGDVNELSTQMSSMQVMLDGQTLVGELTPAIDSALGTNAMRAGRGN